MKKLILLIAACSPCFGGYGYYQTFTTKSALVPSTLTNFTAVISGSYAYLKTTGNGGRVTSASGYDIAIYDSSTCAGTKYDSELVPGSYVATTGQIEIHFRVPSLTNAVQVFYLCAGNSAITTTQNVTTTWRSEYAYVVHAQEATGLTLADSTSNGRAFSKAGSGSPAVTSSGKLTGAQAYNGSSDFIVTAASVNLASAQTVTVSYWMKWTTNANNDSLALETSSTFNSNANTILVDPNESGGTFQVAMKDAIGTLNVATFTRPTAGVFNHFVFVLDKTQGTAANQIKCYVNGVAQTLTFPISNVLTGNFGNYSWYRMSRAGGSLFAPGTLDEDRLYLGALTADWVTTEYNNQSDPASFYTVGTETAVSGGGAPRRSRVVALRRLALASVLDGSAGTTVAYNDQVSGANSWPNNGRYSDLDTTRTAYCANGTLYVTGNDGLGPNATLTSGRNVFLASIPAFTGAAGGSLQTVVNSLDGLGTITQDVYSNGTSIKSGGLHCYGGRMQLWIWQQVIATFMGGKVSMIWSDDNGSTWCNHEHTNHVTSACNITPVSNGDLPTVSQFMFDAATGIRELFEVIYGQDGASNPVVDGNDVYRYFLAGSGDLAHTYGMRVLIADGNKGDGSLYQYYKGGDFRDSANWSNTASDKVAIEPVSGDTNVGSQPIYLSVSHQYVIVSTKSDATNTIWASATPFGPWRLLYTLASNGSALQSWFAPMLNTLTTTGSTQSLYYVNTGVGGQRTGTPSTNPYSLHYNLFTFTYTPRF